MAMSQYSPQDTPYILQYSLQGAIYCSRNIRFPTPDIYMMMMAGILAFFAFLLKEASDAALPSCLDLWALRRLRFIEYGQLIVKRIRWMMMFRC